MAKPAEVACASASGAFSAVGVVFVGRARIPVDAFRPLFVRLDRVHA